MNSSFFTAASRNEIDIELETIEGELPNDMIGVVYINSSVGTVNSDGIPFPTNRPDGTHNKELGSPLLGGDSMIYKLDFNQTQKDINKIKLTSRLLKTPCYYADEATRYYLDKENKKNPLFDSYGFRNFGLTRMSFTLGVRNELCTTVTPFQFKNDKHPRILANYDAGRPYEFDTDTLKIKTPIGANSEWSTSTPPFLNYPFGVVQSTAHPFFDSRTQELISVNMVKSLKTITSQIKLLELLRRNPKEVEEKLENYIIKLEKKYKKSKRFHSKTEQKKFFAKKINNFFYKIDKYIVLNSFYWRKFNQRIDTFVKNNIKTPFQVQESVHLMSWNGNGKWKKWELIDTTTKKPLVIKQCLHQISATKNYIVLVDAGFKLTLDIVFSNPFPHNIKINNFLRDNFTAPMLSMTEVYIVKRSDMRESNKQITVKKLPISLPYETIHFTTDYDNPNDEITLYAAHNATACLAEWIRFYDTNEFTKEPVNKNVIGIPPTGILDISRIGKYKIDGKTGTIIEQKVVTEKGNIDSEDNIGAHTWGIALFTYPNMVDAKKLIPKIKNIYWQAFGLDEQLLTEFIFNMYKEYPQREISIEDIRNYTQKGIPFVISRMNTETMKFEDHYQFEKGVSYRAMQFVPKENKNTDNQQDTLGYIICVVTVPQTTENKESEAIKRCNYQTQLWIFDAQNLNKGAICKLAHPEWIANTTLHSAWIDEAVSTESNYYIDVKKDYQPLIEHTLFGKTLLGKMFVKQRNQIQEIFDMNIYPNFD